MRYQALMLVFVTMFGLIQATSVSYTKNGCRDKSKLGQFVFHKDTCQVCRCNRDEKEYSVFYEAPLSIDGRVFEPNPAYYDSEQNVQDGDILLNVTVVDINFDNSTVILEALWVSYTETEYCCNSYQTPLGYSAFCQKKWVQEECKYELVLTEDPTLLCPYGNRIATMLCDPKRYVD